VSCSLSDSETQKEKKTKRLEKYKNRPGSQPSRNVRISLAFYNVQINFIIIYTPYSLGVARKEMYSMMI